MVVSRRFIVGSVLTLLALLALLALVACGAFYVATYDSRRDLGLDEFRSLASSTDSPNLAHMLDGFSNTTRSTCTQVRAPCIQAYTGERVRMSRFASRERAREFAAPSDDRYQSDWIVIEFIDPATSIHDRRAVTDLVDQTWIDY